MTEGLIERLKTQVLLLDVIIDTQPGDSDHYVRGLKTGLELALFYLSGDAPVDGPDEPASAAALRRMQELATYTNGVPPRQPFIST
jgi:hypothetical protein